MYAIRRLLALTVLVPAFLIASATVANASDAPDRHWQHPVRHHKLTHARHIVINQAGDPYVYGAEGPSAFDCSGLMYYSYRKAGLYMPRTASEQYHHTRHIPRRHMIRGDFLFFHDSGGSVYHVAMAGHRKHGHITMWHAPHTGTVVHKARPWTGSYYSGTLRLK